MRLSKWALHDALSPLLLQRDTTIIPVALVSGALGLLLSQSTLLPGLLLILLVSLFLASAGVVIRLDFRARRDMFSPLILVTIYYVLGFALGSIYYWQFSEGRFTHGDLLFALVLGQAAWLLLVFGYFADPFRSISCHIPNIATHGMSCLRIAVPLFVIGWLARAGTVASGHYFHNPPPGTIAVASTGVSWFIYAASLLPTVAVALLGSGARPSRRTFGLLVAVEFAWYVPTGERGSVISLAFVLLAIRFYRTRCIPWRLLGVAAVLGVFIVLPVGLAYRGNNVGYQQHPGQRLTRVAGQLVSGGFTDAARSGVDATLSRFSDVASMATISARGPETLDRPFGQTLSWGLTAFVPRFFMPSKPDPGLFGNEFGRKFGIIAPNDRITSVAISEPGEFWMSVGVGGLVLGMFVVGALYRVLDTLLSARGRNAGATALYSVLIWPLVQSQGTIVAQGLLGCVKLLVFVALILVVIDAPSYVARTSRGRGEAIHSGKLEGAA